MELINAIKKQDQILAIKLIESGDIDVGYMDEHNNTALTWACGCSMKEVVNESTDSLTMTSVSLALIATGKSKPEQISNGGYIALMRACK